MNPRLGAKERSKSTGWSSSTVICVRGAGQGCFFRYKTGSISVTGSFSAARTRVYDTNPPLVGLVRPVSASYAPAMSFSFSSTPHRGRSLTAYRMSILAPEGIEPYFHPEVCSTLSARGPAAENLGFRAGSKFWVGVYVVHLAKLRQELKGRK